MGDGPQVIEDLMIYEEEEDDGELAALEKRIREEEQESEEYRGELRRNAVIRKV